MIELRFKKLDGASADSQKLQYRALFYPCQTDTGGLVIKPSIHTDWMDVPLVVVPGDSK